MSRLTLCALLMLMTLQSYSQNHYTFAVQSVSSYPEAKPVIAILRKAFNTENPRLFFPVFQADQHQFVADSEMQLGEQKLRDLLAAQGYVLVYFKAEQIIKPESEEE